MAFKEWKDITQEEKYAAFDSDEPRNFFDKTRKKRVQIKL